ncbi:MAG: hypothetical protein Q4G25_14130, partial [Paracoccus sp. (in: a-proteobacteria)]|nr:hypothetical protein [Paracoccus sp. (in: a-proteobacteria)]
MARSYGFGRGALHGALIGAGALAVLSLALPGPQTRPAVPEAGESARPGVGGGAGPAAPATGAGPAGDAPAPPVPDDDGGLSAPQAESGQGPDAVMQEAGGVAGGGAGVLSPAARTGGAGIAPDAVTDSRPSGGDDTGVPVTRMSPPPGSEFARREDLPPVVPAPSAAPGLGQSAAPAVSVPVAENAPQAATLPGARPDPLSAADTLQPVEDQPAGPATPAPDPARPATAPAPGAVDAPARDTGPMPASRAAPAPPPEDEVTILPGSEGRP